MMRIHHNTAKKAKKFGVELRVSVDEFEAVVNGSVIASAPSANTALDKAITKLSLNGSAKPKSKVSARKPRDEEEDESEESEEEEEEESEGHSIVRKKYKTKYRPFKSRCGDELSDLISNHVGYEDDAGEWKVDPTKLKRFAKANDCWKSEYASLNVGQQRMNVGNRLRSKVKKGHDTVWS